MLGGDVVQTDKVMRSWSSLFFPRGAWWLFKCVLAATNGSILASKRQTVRKCFRYALKTRRVPQLLFEGFNCVFGPFEQFYQASPDQFDQEEPLLITFLFHILSEGKKR